MTTATLVWTRDKAEIDEILSGWSIGDGDGDDDGRRERVVVEGKGRFKWRIKGFVAPAR